MKQILISLLGIGALGACALALLFLYIFYSLPAPEILADWRVPESTRIYDRTGEVLLYEIHGNEKRVLIPLADIPEKLKQATIAVEDEEFYTHPAFSIRGIIRGLIIKPLTGARAQGGSTITQQLVKNAFLTRERTVIRKLKELALSIQFERRFSKDQILEFYLNQIPYGATAYGIESASQLFFKKPARDLTLAESALLASIPQAPSYYSPWGSHVDELLARKDYALARMYAVGFISAEEQEAAMNEKIVFANPSQGIRAPHFVLAVQSYLEGRYGEDVVRTGGLIVKTTLNWDMQEIAEKAVYDGAIRNEELYKGTNASLVAEDPQTGQILALVGSRDYFDDAISGKFNVAMQGLRQPGSALKPFVYAAAFGLGYTPNTILFDVPTEFDTTGNPARSYRPENYDGKYRGPITIKSALAQSLNIPAVKALYLVGLDRALKTAQAFGLGTLTEKSRYGLSLVLGGGEVRLIDLVGAYSAFAADGISHTQSLILEVRTKDGVLESYEDKNRRVVEAQDARLINNILSDIEARRPLFSGSLSLTTVPDREIALKTGTTNDYRDAWALGYAPNLVVGVWAGNNDNTPMERKGGSILAAVPIWHTFMASAIKDLPYIPFVRPSQITVGKPILRGEYIVTYIANGKEYPQFHDTLFYINPKDPQGPEPKNPADNAQFKNWEPPALAWGKENIANFDSLNEPLPPGSSIAENILTALTSPFTVTIEAPANGTFASSLLVVEANITSPSPISRVELYINDALIDTTSLSATSPFRYTKALSLTTTDPQNILKIVAWNESGQSAEVSSIFFKTP